MRLTKLICTAAIALSLPMLAHAESVEQAVSAALQTHPQIHAAQAAIGASQARRSQEVSNYFPLLSAGAAFGRIYGDNATTRGQSVTRGAAYSYYGEGSISARQLIFDGFQTQKRLDAARAESDAAIESLQEAQENLAFEATRTYIDLLRSYKALVLIENQVAKAEDYLSRIQIAMNEGIGDEAEYRQALDVKVALKGLLAEYTGQAAEAETQYQQLTGYLPDTKMMDPNPNVNAISGDVQTDIDYALNNHPALLSALRQVQSAEFSTDAEQASLFPDFTGELSYLQSDKAEELGGEIEDARALLRMNWEFEIGGAYGARVREREFETKRAEAQLEDVKNRIIRGIRLAYAEYDTAVEVLNNQTQRTALAHDLYNTYEVQFQGGIVNVLQLMQADNQYFLNKLDQVNSAYRVLLSQYAILSSTGRLAQSVSNLPVQNAGI